MIFVDYRWEGNHGIGRFCREIVAAFDSPVLWADGSNPASALSPLRFGAAARKYSPEFAFSPGYVPPLYSNVPFIFTIHDLIHLDVAEESSVAKRLFYEYVVRPAIGRAFKIATVSEFSKQRIVQWSGCRSDKVVVVGNGVSRAFSPTGNKVGGLPYILYVGNRKPHKNVPVLLQAMRLLALETGSARLIMSGFPSTDIISFAEMNSGLNIEFIGPCDDWTLSSYYRGAIAVVVPSKYEGFGLPLLEAMACGTPTVIAKTAALLEISGGSALDFDADAPEELARILVTLTADEYLRAKLSLMGLARAVNFSWQSTRRIILDAIVMKNQRGQI